MANQRVGITAFSHAAIANLLKAVVECFRERDDLSHLRAVCKGSAPSGGALDGVTYVG